MDPLYDADTIKDTRIFMYEMKDILFGIGLFFVTLMLGGIIRGILNQIKKPSCHVTRIKGEICAVTVYLYSISRHSSGGRWYEYSFTKKKYWRYKWSKFAFLTGIILYALMIVVIGLFCIEAENGYTFFIHIVPYLGIALLAGGLVDPLSAYCCLLKITR